MRTLSASKVYKIAAIIGYVIGYIYLKYVLCSDLFGIFPGSIWILAFSVLFIVWTEGFAYLTGNTYKKLYENGKSYAEPVIFIVCILLQAIAITAWGLHEDWEIYQVPIWHFTIMYYVICRMGLLAAGRSGIFFVIDSIKAVASIPISNFLLIFIKLFEKDADASIKEEPERQRNKVEIKYVVVSVIIAVIVCLIAFSQLVSVSETFAGIGGGINAFIRNILSAGSVEYFFTEILPYVVLAVPFSCWIYGLVAGSIQTENKFMSDKEIEDETRHYHILPSYSTYIIIGSVCVLYGIFCISALVDVLNGNMAATAHEASVGAVGSFWQLIKVVVLNMAIMFASCFVSKKALWEQKSTRILATILFVFALVFALLAAWNLIGIYIVVYGLTPRRILSSWVVVNVIVWCVLILIRLYKKISAAQIGILFAACSFSLVVCACF